MVDAMENVIPFLNVNASQDDFRRLTDDLRAAFERGDDLGSRAIHIEKIATEINIKILNLRAEIENLERIRYVDGATHDVFLESCEKLCDDLETIANSFIALSNHAANVEEEQEIR
ncbi:hypothetical protein QA634_28615 [Methylobacterium sp. CB376]|uniref:hypothetical protein n=1 Tax=unclassified Methylobacterium TaxID=2615210 RepID=UPI00123756EE|nr:MULTISPECIES: hypothetical protein [Methylobacterium]WFT79149.1 hypothetical protein QA634_28615 [Methylobacterium nodulans]